jgi:hypothetical protein
MLSAMFSLPGLLMFILGVLLSGTVMAWFGRARTSVTGG